MTAAEKIVRLRQCAPGETITVTLTWAEAQWWAEWIFRHEMNMKDNAK